MDDDRPLTAAAQGRLDQVLATHYFSTACLHQNHPRCRLRCKYCDRRCRCHCHDHQLQERAA